MFDFVTTKRTLISLGLIVLIGTSLPGCGGDKKPPQNPFGPTTQRPPSRRPTHTTDTRLASISMLQR